MSANTRFETLGDIVAKGGNIKVRCACGHTAVIEGAGLNRWYKCHGWSTRMHMLRDHLRCTRCRQRPERVSPSPNKPDVVAHFPQDEAGWSRLVRRLRD